jgi:hypothetical protein
MSLVPYSSLVCYFTSDSLTPFQSGASQDLCTLNQVINIDPLVIGMHLLSHARPKNNRRSISVLIHKPNVGSPFTTADDGLFAKNFGKVPAESPDNRAVRRDCRRLGKIASKNDFRRMLF